MVYTGLYDFMKLQREAPDPLYQQIIEGLIAEIRAGNFEPHQRLPSERELSEQYQVSRMTVRHALLSLASDGVVYTRVGKGTFVASDISGAPTVADLLAVFQPPPNPHIDLAQQHPKRKCRRFD